MRVRLTRKLADVMDGVDVSRVVVGDVMDLPDHKAHLLIAEGWAESVRRSDRRSVIAFQRDGVPVQSCEGDQMSRAS